MLCNVLHVCVKSHNGLKINTRKQHSELLIVSSYDKLNSPPLNSKHYGWQLKASKFKDLFLKKMYIRRDMNLDSHRDKIWFAISCLLVSKRRTTPHSMCWSLGILWNGVNIKFKLNKFMLRIHAKTLSSLNMACDMPFAVSDVGLQGL